MPDAMIVTERPPLKNLAAALCKAQADMEGAKKDTTNPHFNRKYADLASVWSAIREPLTKNGLSVVQLLRSINGGVECETILLHTSGEQISETFAVPATKSDAQGYGSAATYARRYALMALVGVAPEEDDGNAAAASHKPGAPGMAGGGGDFRPPPRQGSASGHRMAMEEPELVANAAGRLKGTMPAKQKPAAIEKAKTWTDNAIGTLNLSAQTVDSLSKFLSENNDKIEWLEANAPDQHERFFTAYNNAAEAARAQVAA